MINRRKKRVLIVDDSALMRSLLTQIIESSEDLEVVGVARDPYVAWEKVNELDPDVLTLDVEMPRMDGIEFLRKLMIAKPTPVVMVSSLTEENCEVTLKALELGAIDFVAKPKMNLLSGTMELAEQIIEKVTVASRATPRKPVHVPTRSVPKKAETYKSDTELIAIGSSTGGTNALHGILAELPPNSPGMVIVQHMPAGFTRRFAARLNEASNLQVREAKQGDTILPGTVLIAPGGLHMEVVRQRWSLEICLHDKPPVNRFRPSVDVLFKSVADHVGKKSVGVILTGMGDDGAQGMKAMHDKGATTIAQDEASCVVFGMPKAAIEAGGVTHVCPLSEITQTLLGRQKKREVSVTENCYGSV